MKRINTVFLIPALLLASCSEDTDMTTYNGRSDEAFFEKTAYSYSVSADLEDSYTIEVLRATPSGNASVKAEIIVDDETIADAFTVSETIEFADGEHSSEVKVSFDRSRLTVGKENVVTVRLISETDLPYATECSLTVTRDYTWKAHGIGTYTSGILTAMFGGSISWDQEIEVAEEKPQLYRMKDFYHNAGTPYSVSGYHLSFIWDGGQSITFTAPENEEGCVTVPSGFSHPSYKMVSLYIDPSPEYSGYDAASKTFTFNCAGLVSLGMLVNWTKDTFTLNE